MILSVIGFIKKVFRPLIVVLSIIIIIFLALSWIGIIVSFFYTFPFAEYFIPGSNLISSLAALSFYLLIAIPISLLIMTFVRIINRQRLHPNIRNGIVLFGIGNMIFLSFLGSRIFRHFNQQHEKVEILGQLEPAMIKLNSRSLPEEKSLMQLGDLQLTKEALISNEVDVRITKTDGPQAEIVRIVSARGESNADALKYTNDIVHHVTLEQGVVNYDHAFKIPQGSKWRNQHITLEIRLPVNGTISFPYEWKINAPILNEDHPQFGQTNQWKMDAEGHLICLDCPPPGKEDLLQKEPDVQQ